MSNKLGAVFSSGKDDWRTPLSTFSALNSEFLFTVDGAADAGSALLPRWFGPGSSIPDALVHPWAEERVWLNPPYSQVKAFIAKAAAERLLGALTVALIPSRTDTRYWHDYIWDQATHACRPGVSLRFIKGRIKFINPAGALRVPTPSVVSGSHAPNNSAPFPSVVVIFKP